MFFATFAVFFGVCASFVHGIGDNCQLATTFTNSKAPRHLLQVLDFDVDVLMNFVDFTNAQVELKNIQLNTANKTFSPRTVSFLAIPFNVTFRYAKVNQLNFSRNDNNYSQIIKAEIIEFVWQNVHDTSFLSNCFQTPELLTGNLTLDANDSALNLTKMPEINWVERGYVTRVKNQDPCFSCWAFPTVGLIESFHKKKTGQLLTFSEQRLLSCRKGHHELSGCGSKNGGNVGSGLKAIRDNGTCLESREPWIGKDGRCKVMPATDLFYKNARFIITQFNLKTTVPEELQKGPIAGTVYINPVVSPWDSFKGKEILKVKCPGSVATNHAILIVGSGTYKGEEYLLIKNSWDMDWGDNGYAKIAVGRYDDSCLKQFVSIS